MATTTTYNLKQKIEAINTSKNEIKSAIEDKIEASIGESYEILGNIQTYANEIGKIVTPNNQTLPTITENGTYEYNVDTYTGLNNVTVNVNQSVQDKTITENGTYNASEGYIGFGEVTVDIDPPSLITKTITQNGTYKAEDDNIYGYDEVVVDVTGEFLVQVIDYDGTVLKSEMLNEGQVFTLPEETPTHSGLIFQEWSSPVDIEDNSVTVGQSDIIIGATYTTASGLSEFDITLTKVTGLTVTLYLSGMKDWGDGTVNDEESHTYSTYGNYTVSCSGTITDGSFLGSTNSHILTNVRLANITEIGNSAFYNCYSLKTITISNSVTNVDTRAFYNCQSLTSIVIPKNVVHIGSECFQSCYSLESVVLTKKISSIEYATFNGCNSLSSITIPNSVINIRHYSFASCSLLKSISIPNGVKTIGGNAFSGCVGLQSIYLLNSLVYLGQSTFYSCHSLKYIKTINGLNNLPSNVFHENTSLKSVSLNDNVTKIDDSAFTSCVSLTSIKMPSTVTQIGNSAFYYCKSIVEYDFSEHTSVPTLSNTSAFNGINAICKIKVPASLENEWKSATNWSTYANYIVGV